MIISGARKRTRHELSQTRVSPFMIKIIRFGKSLLSMFEYIKSVIISIKFKYLMLLLHSNVPVYPQNHLSPPYLKRSWGEELLSSMEFHPETEVISSMEFHHENLSSLFLNESDHMPSEKYKFGNFDAAVRREIITIISQVTDHKTCVVLCMEFLQHFESPLLMSVCSYVLGSITSYLTSP